jgi:hypothetical protein
MKSHANFNALAFNKAAIVELNNTHMRQTNSGGTPAVIVIWLVVDSSIPCGLAIGGAISHTIDVTING